MAFSDQLQIVADQSFRDRITMAIIVAAQGVQGEAETEGHDSFYEKRSALARAILNGPAEFTDRFCWSVAANPAITAESSDSDIQFTVNSVFSDMAGVMANETP